jgi:hypothetical protein
VTPLGDDRYLLEETEWMVGLNNPEETEWSLNYHDVIQAEYLGASKLRFVRVARRSDLLLMSAILPLDFLGSAEVESALDWLGQRGGYWQRDFGGCLILSIPKEVEREFSDRWDQVIDLHRRGLTHPGERIDGRTATFTASLIDHFRKTDLETN